jgi:predicted esterase
MKTLIISLYLTSILSSSLFGQEEYPYSVTKDLVYQVHGKTLLFDRYYDSTTISQPTVILIHGGAFQKVFGEKEYMQLIATDIAEAGYQVFNVNYLQEDIYVTADEAFWQSAHALDAFFAHLISKKSEYNVDTKNIFLLGHSAGAILGLGFTFMDRGDINDDQNQMLLKYGMYHHHGISIQGVVSIAGGWIDPDNLTDNSSTEILLIHAKDDPVVPSGTGTAFTQIGDHYNNFLFDLKTQMMDGVNQIVDDLDIGEMGLQERFTNESNRLFLPLIYGSESIHEAFKEKNLSNCSYLAYPGKGHRLSQVYRSGTKDIIIHFLKYNTKISNQTVLKTYITDAKHFISMHKKICITAISVLSVLVLSYKLKLF